MISPQGQRFIQQKWHCACECERIDNITPRTGVRIGHPQYTKPDNYWGIPQAFARAEWYARQDASLNNNTLRAVK